MSGSPSKGSGERFLVTADEIGDPQDLAIACMVGNERVQDARTSAMYFGVAEIISYCSMSFTLEPGDVIATGTPAGVGVFREPPRFLGDGDRVAVEIEGIGRLENICRFDRPGAVA
jgi:2-keto-4-pentenoate hydratase/2-oxohepta-3-ene-1,7-dioic acid hydratase in catechol pathway